MLSLTLATSAGAYTLVIDPGHGGKDIGAPGNITNEKTVVLDVAKRLHDIISKEHPEIKVIMTRDKDVFVTLKGRADLANKADADLFISIHCDAVADKRRAASVCGSTVYVLGPNKSDTNLEVLKRENSVIEMEESYRDTYKDVDALSTEQLIMLELNQNLAGSLDFAELASAYLHEMAGRTSRGDKSVMPCGFYVLVYTKMPSVLVELDFICNPTVEKFLHSSDGKDKCARALADAFTAYYRMTGSHESQTNAGKSGNQKASAPEKKDAKAKAPAKAKDKDEKGGKRRSSRSRK